MYGKAQGKPRSLRLRLLLGYGILFTIALGVLTVLVLVLTTNAINQSVDNAIQAEARIAMLDVRDDLSPLPPYWQDSLSMHVVDTYRDPGVVVEVLDAKGHMHYLSARDTSTGIPTDTHTLQTVLAGQTVWYTTTVEKEQVRVEALPIRAPTAQTNENAGSTKGSVGVSSSDAGPVVGVLLIAKVLGDVTATLLLLRTLLLFVVSLTLVGALIGTWILASHVLRPLSEIVATARAIVTSTAHGTRLGNLSQRIRRPGGRDEMAQVVDTLNEMLASLERATQAQRRFVADASHELRAPLTTIRGNLAFLQHHLDELPLEERHSMLADAQGETLRLVQLVEELLLLARADAGEGESLALQKEDGMVAGDNLPQRSLVELDHAILQLVRQLRRRLQAEESKLKLEVGHIEPVRVRGDEESLRRVTLILLDNALKYTPVGDEGGTGRVIVSLERKDGQAVLRVRDTGIGIEPADLPHIFERFYRTDRARTRQGTGLGLSIAQTLVEQLDGRITVESTPGKGSTFSVWLPLAWTGELRC